MSEEHYASWTYKDVEITVTQDGHFAAVVNEERLWAATKVELQGLIDEALTFMAKQQSANLALKVVGLLSPSGYFHKSVKATIHHDVLRAIHRSTGKPLFQHLPQGHQLDYVCADTPDAEEALQHMLSTQDQLQAAKQAVYAFMFQPAISNPIGIEKYPAVVNDLIARYNKAKGAFA